MLSEYVSNTLEKLLSEYINENSNLKKYTNNALMIGSLEGDIETYSEIIGGMQEFSYRFEGQLNPKVNKRLRRVLGNFVRKALRDNENPSQLYEKILDVYNQEVFSKGDEALVILLSKIYWEALKTLGNPDPITGQKYYASRQDKENALKIIDVVEELLGKALHKYWLARGKDIDIDEIMDNLKEQARPFYAMWEAVKSKIESLTPYDSVKYAFNKLVIGLENNYILFIQGLIVSAYDKRSAPEHIRNVLEYLISKDFFKNVFNEMYNEIGNYIKQLQPTNQQYRQQADQPNIQQLVQQPSQPPANQQPVLQQQQTPQVQNQLMLPKKLSPSLPLQGNNSNIPKPKVIKSSP
jgi:hypothetical protein